MMAYKLLCKTDGECECLESSEAEKVERRYFSEIVKGERVDINCGTYESDMEKSDGQPGSKAADHTRQCGAVLGGKTEAQQTWYSGLCGGQASFEPDDTLTDGKFDKIAEEERHVAKAVKGQEAFAEVQGPSAQILAPIVGSGAVATPRYEGRNDINGRAVGSIIVVGNCAAHGYGFWTKTGNAGCIWTTEVAALLPRLCACCFFGIRTGHANRDVKNDKNGRSFFRGAELCKWNFLRDTAGLGGGAWMRTTKH
jgi:hypothetical protein